MPADYRRIHRILEILTLIQSGEPWNARRLADHFQVAERTVFRDLEAMQDVGIPYYFDEEWGGYRVRRDYFMPPVELTAEEALALVALGAHVAEREQIPLTGPAAVAISKIRCHLPNAIRAELEPLEGRVAIELARAGPTEGIKDVHDRVQEAIATRRVLRCRYESIRRTVEAAARRDDEPPTARDEPFELRPYTLLFNQRAWYVIGHHGGRNAIRSLKLNRFTAIEPTDKPYMIPDDFSLREHFGNAWRMIRGDRSHEIELSFDPRFADGIAETLWHPTQEVEHHPDGSITFRCTVDGLDEIEWWVLGMGPHCLVRRPRALADRVRTLAETLLARYAGDEEDAVA